MKQIKLENGKTISITPASFKDATALKSSVVKALASQGIKLPNSKEDIMKMEVSNDMLVGVLTNILLMESNEEITDRVMECAKKCLYEDEKITADLFEDSELWPILIEIKIAVIKANVLPFFVNLPSIAKKLLGSINLDTILK